MCVKTDTSFTETVFVSIHLTLCLTSLCAWKMQEVKIWKVIRCRLWLADILQVNRVMGYPVHETLPLDVSIFTSKYNMSLLAYSLNQCCKKCIVNSEENMWVDLGKSRANLISTWLWVPVAILNFAFFTVARTDQTWPYWNFWGRTKLQVA